jgi:hypothetical protein
MSYSMFLLLCHKIIKTLTIKLNILKRVYVYIDSKKIILVIAYKRGSSVFLSFLGKILRGYLDLLDDTPSFF